MLYAFVKLLSRIVCMLPLGVRHIVGQGIGALGWLLVSRRRREMAVDNIVLGLGIEPGPAGRVAKQSATRFGRMFMDVLYFPRIGRNNIRQYVTIEGREHMEEALSFGRGVILVTAHSGNWELMGAALAMNDFPLAVVVQKQTNAAMDRFINEYRTLVGMQVTYKTSVREMLRLLGEGKIVALLMDQDARHNGVFVNFFGRPASTPQGAAALARLKDAPIVPAFITENGTGCHTIIVHPYIWVNKSENKEQDIVTTTQQLTTIIEQHIRNKPQEWFWLHNRWKTKPSVK